MGLATVIFSPSPPTLAAARASLEVACDDLDDAVRELSEVDQAKVMVSPELVTLLLRVVAARRTVRGLELGAVARSVD